LQLARKPVNERPEAHPLHVTANTQS